MVEGQNQRTKDMASDLEAMLKRTVTIDTHRSNLSELEGNMRTLIKHLENKLSNQEDVVKKMEEQAKSLQSEYEEQQKIIQSVKSSGIFGEDGKFDPNDPKAVAAMMHFVSKISSLLSGMMDDSMSGDMDDPNNPYSSKGGFPRISHGSKESFMGGKGRVWPGGAMMFEDESNLTP